MAASKPERDFAHLIADALGSELHAISAVPWELDYRTPFEFVPGFTTNSSAVIVRLGDNITADAYDEGAFSGAYRDLLRALAPVANLLVCTSTWYPRWFNINDTMRAACLDAGGQWVRLDDLSDRWENHASYERNFPSSVVGTHPGDLGMRRIAERILDAIAGRTVVQPVSCLALPWIGR